MFIQSLQNNEVCALPNRLNRLEAFWVQINYPRNNSERATLLFEIGLLVATGKIMFFFVRNQRFL